MFDAIAAMTPNDPLDELLGDDIVVNYAGRSVRYPGKWLAVVNDRRQGRMLAGKDFEGTGATVSNAIRAAVASAKAARDV